MRWWQTKPKKQLPKPVVFDINDGDLVELTLIGIYSEGVIRTKKDSWFITSLRQTDPAITIRRVEI